MLLAIRAISIAKYTRMSNLDPSCISICMACNFGVEYASLYAPVGEGSLLSMRCRVDGCSEIKIYEDWTTEIYMEPLPVGGGLRAFYKTKIKNIFDHSSLNIPKSDPNYVELNFA